MEKAVGSETRGDAPAAIPYNEYFVLQNQSTDVRAKLPEETYRNIRSRPLDSVFSEKWQQVQRSTDKQV
jgi:hypothetical protein